MKSLQISLPSDLSYLLSSATSKLLRRASSKKDPRRKLVDLAGLIKFIRSPGTSNGNEYPRTVDLSPACPRDECLRSRNDLIFCVYLSALLAKISFEGGVKNFNPEEFFFLI